MVCNGEEGSHDVMQGAKDMLGDVRRKSRWGNGRYLLELWSDAERTLVVGAAVSK